MTELPGSEQLLRPYLASLPVFPLNNMVFFPNTTLPLHIFEPRYREMVRDARDTGSPIVMACLKPIDDRYPPPLVPPIYPIAGAGFIKTIGELPDGRYLIELFGAGRVRIEEELPQRHAYRRVRAVLVSDEIDDSTSTRMTKQISTLKSLLYTLGPQAQPVVAELHELIESQAPAPMLADVCAHTLFTDPEERRTLLEEANPSRRLGQVIDRLSDQLLTQSSGTKN